VPLSESHRRDRETERDGGLRGLRLVAPDAAAAAESAAVKKRATKRDRVLHELHRVHILGVQTLMATKEIKDAMARIDAATTAIAARLAKLVGQIGTGMSDADVAAVTAGLTAEATKLEGLGADPDNPVPQV
jgi:multidrug resistance efflux pump